jgi:peptidoglycan/xylan/chitin deacetylase (PgdA/CDA1 family)
MDWLKANGYRTVTLSQAVKMMTGGKIGSEKLACLTFDDAYQDLYRCAWPVLKEHGFTATVFALSDYVGRENDWDINWGGRRFRHLGLEEMREMQASGIEIGSHGASHRDLRHLKDGELQQELSGSKRSLEDSLGREVTAFCYPFGRYDRRVRRAVIEAGYRCACSHSPRMRNSSIDYFALRRCGVYITDAIWDFRQKVDQRSSWFWTQDLWSRTVNFCAGGTILARRIIFPRDP